MPRTDPSSPAPVSRCAERGLTRHVPIHGSKPSMFNKIRNWRARRIVARRPIAEALWRDALRRCAPARRLGASDQATLRVLATLFLESKSLEPVKGLELDDA